MAPGKRRAPAQSQPAEADFAAQDPSALGRGHRDPQPTERIQTFREYLM